MPKPNTCGLFGAASLVTLLESAGVTKSSLIRVTGPSALSALLWLCRHGYQQVGYVRPGVGRPHEEPDALIVAHSCDATDLESFLSLARQVRPGGALILQVRATPGMRIDEVLDAHGYAVERHLEGERRILVVARRHGVAWRKAA